MEFGFRPGDPTGPTDRDDLRLIVEVERWRDGADDDAVAVLDGVMGKCLPIRPLLDALGWRALPHLDVEAACAWHRDRVLLFTADTCAQLLDEGYSRKRYDGVAERFCEIARPLARELLVALGTDVARGEAAGARVVATDNLTNAWYSKVQNTRRRCANQSKRILAGSWLTWAAALSSSLATKA